MKDMKKIISDLLDQRKKSTIRYDAALALGQTNSSLAIEPLKAALNDPDESVSAQAAVSLANTLEATDKSGAWSLIFENKWDELIVMGDSAVPALSEALDLDEPLLLLDHTEIMKYLFLIADTKAVQPLCAYLVKNKSTYIEYADVEYIDLFMFTFSDQEECIKAEEIIGKLDCQEAIKTLVACLQENYREVRIAAAIALDELGWKPESKQEEAWNYSAHSAWHKLIGLGNVAINVLIADSVYTSWYFMGSDALEATKALGMIGDVRALVPLIKRFESLPTDPPDDSTILRSKSFIILNNYRDAIIEALQKIMHRLPAENLKAAFLSNDQEVREIAIEALITKSSPDNLEEPSYIKNKSGIQAANEYLARIRYDRQFKLRAEKCVNESELEAFLKKEGYDFSMSDLAAAKEKYSSLKTNIRGDSLNAHGLGKNEDKSNSEQELLSGSKAAKEFLIRVRTENQLRMRVQKCINTEECFQLARSEGYSFTEDELNEAKKWLNFFK